MFRIVYASTSVAPFSEPELRDLLAQARANNAEAGVTGMLVYSGGQFLQVLEGEPAAVIGTFERIAADPRHMEIVTLQRGNFADQWFANWAMGFHSAQVAPGQVAVSGRIRLDALDELSAVDFLRACSRAQTF